MSSGNRWRMIGWGVAVALVLAPLVAMQFTSEVDWTLADFIVAGVMIGSVGLLFELGVRASRSWPYRGGVALALAGGFLMTWSNLAVGIIGNEDNPANLVFFATLAIAIAGAIVARGKAAYLARAMRVAAAAQALVGIIVLGFGIAATEPPGPIGLFILIEGFAAMWFASAWLFAKAGRLAASRP